MFVFCVDQFMFDEQRMLVGDAKMSMNSSLQGDETPVNDDMNETDSDKDDKILSSDSNVEDTSGNVAITENDEDEYDDMLSAEGSTEKVVDAPLVDSAGDSSSDDTKPSSEEVVLKVPSKQRVVTFEDMTQENVTEVYHGPLILTEQLIEPGEDLTRIIFCRHFISTNQEPGAEQDKGYNEYSVPTITDGLQRCQKFYNSHHDVKPLDLVFFEQAVRHAARLSRCLVRFIIHLAGKMYILS